VGVAVDVAVGVAVGVAASDGGLMGLFFSFSADLTTCAQVPFKTTADSKRDLLSQHRL